MKKQYELTITLEEAGKTVKQMLTGNLSLGTAQIKKAKFRQNGIMVNGVQVTVRHVLAEGDVLQVLIEDNDKASAHLVPMEGDLHIVYEDEDCLVVEKHAGMVCHPSGGHYCDSMANLLVGYYKAQGQGFVVRLLGRLDKDTSGLLLYAKNAPALTDFERQRNEGQLQKTYYALVHGCPVPGKGTIEQAMEADPDVEMKQRVCVNSEGQYALTHYEVLGSSQAGQDPDEVAHFESLWKDTGTISLVKLHIETGRTHQIRCHMSWLGHPLIGDAMYGKGELLDRHALHAGELSFLQPTTKERITVSCPIPEDMSKLMEDVGLSRLIVLKAP